MVSGIYQITNTVTGDSYVWRSQNLASRWKKHCYELSRGTHQSPLLQAAWNEYGKDSFKFEVLRKCPFNSTELKYWESYWIRKLKPSLNSIIPNDAAFDYWARQRQTMIETTGIYTIRA